MSLTYSAFVAQLMQEIEDIDAVNDTLEKWYVLDVLFLAVTMEGGA